MSKPTKKYDGNNIFATVFAIAMMIIMALVAIFVYRDSTTDFDIIRDAISGMEFSSYEIRDEIVKTNIPTNLLDNYYAENLESDIISHISLYFNQTHRDFENISYRQGSLKEQSDLLNFELESDTGEKYKTQLKNLEGAGYELEIHNYNDLVYSYRSTEHQFATRNSLTLANLALPASIPCGENCNIGIISADSKELTVFIESEDKKLSNDDLVSAAKAWLKSNNYSPEDFTYKVENSEK